MTDKISIEMLDRVDVETSLDKADTAIQQASVPLAVNLFGVGSTYDDMKFDLAIDAAVGMPGGSARVYIPPRIYEITQVEIPQGVELVLDKGAIIRPRAATSSLFKITGGLSGINGGQLTNQSGFAPVAVIVDKPDDNLDVFLERTYYASFTNHAIRWDDGDCLNLLQNQGVANGIFLGVKNDCRNSELQGNNILGGNGFQFEMTTQGAEGIEIYGNSILPATGGSYCIDLKCGLAITIEGNIFDQMTAGQAIGLDGSAHAIYGVDIINNWMGRNFGPGGVNANFGIYAVNNVKAVLSSGNKFSGFQQAAIHLNGTAGGLLQNFTSRDDVFYVADPSLRDFNLTYAENILIENAMHGGSISIVENTGVTGNVINGDYTRSARPSAINLGLRYGRQKAGMILRSKGTATLAATTKIATINHGLHYTPADVDISIEGNGFPNNAPGELVADTIGATTFRAVCRNDPGASGYPVKWSVNIER